MRRSFLSIHTRRFFFLYTHNLYLPWFLLYDFDLPTYPHFCSLTAFHVEYLLACCVPLHLRLDPGWCTYCGRFGLYCFRRWRTGSKQRTKNEFFFISFMTNTDSSDEGAPHKQDFKLTLDAHDTFLAGYVATYRAFEQTEQSRKKGSKQKYIHEQIVPHLVTNFGLEAEYNLESIRKAVVRYFYNRGVSKAQEIAVQAPLKRAKPKEKGGQTMYREANSVELSADAKALTPASLLGVPRANLPY
ncbi:hypothetical protein B0H19DRAFT_654301 [Mycena capillaripes]|nr:hypothetical protein B0H19DRAFT_654301 [Mycena capillaripes]